ncbi:DUF2972 domain-containing protein [Campylobacter lari]|nr:DUF2972 domain-containing protein [Campylobacter lari]
MTVKKDQDILSKKIIEFFIQSAKNNIDFDTFKQHSLDFQKEIYDIISKHEFIIKKYYNKIITWLNSKEFQEYSNNKPFPCLFPLKHINYDEIDAELAWYLNIPIKDNYDIVWLQKGSSGTNITMLYFELCNILTNEVDFHENSNNFDLLFNDMKTKKQVCIIRQPREDLCYFINKKIYLFFIARDPISIIKHALNHSTFSNPFYVNPKIKKINLKNNFIDLFPSVTYQYSKTKQPTITSLSLLITNYSEWYFNTQKKLDILMPYIADIECIEFSQIDTKNGFDTFTKLAKKYNLTPPQDPKPFQGRINRSQGDLVVLPVIFYANKHDLDPQSTVNSFKSKESLKIVISTHYLSPDIKDYMDITKEIFDNRKLMFNNIILLIKNKDYQLLHDDEELFLASKKYLNDYMDALEEHEQKIKDNLITEEQILDYLKDKKDLRVKLKQLIDTDLTYVRENHPEYLQKWKYYQKFEELCKK